MQSAAGHLGSKLDSPLGRRLHAMTTDFISVQVHNGMMKGQVVHLILTTLAGEDTQLTIYQFENAVLEQLPKIGESSDLAVSWTLYVACSMVQWTSLSVITARHTDVLSALQAYTPLQTSRLQKDSASDPDQLNARPGLRYRASGGC